MFILKNEIQILEYTKKDKQIYDLKTCYSTYTICLLYIYLLLLIIVIYLQYKILNLYYKTP